MNAAAHESAEAWLTSFRLSPQQKPALNIVGPLSSGKTRLALLLCSRVVNPLVVSPLDREPAELARTIRTLIQSYTVRSVADYAGLSYSPRIDILVVEDAEFIDSFSARLLVEIARCRLLPIVCISPEPLKRPSPVLFKQIRLFRPTVRQAAVELSRSSGIADDVALALCARFGGDLRQAKIELGLLYGRSGPTVVKAHVSATDPQQRTAVEAARSLFSHISRDSVAQEVIRASDRDDATLVRALVAEHYVKTTCSEFAEAAEALSLADVLPPSCRHVADVVGLSAVGFASGAKIPYSLATTAAPPINRCSVHWTLIEAVERRIVQSLSIYGARAVAQEMRSLGTPLTISEWERVRAAAALGRPPTSVPLDLRTALAEEISHTTASRQ